MLIIVQILITAILIYLSFLVMKPLRFDKLMPYTPQQAIILKILLSIALGFILSLFVMQIMNWMQNIYQLFQPLN